MKMTILLFSLILLASFKTSIDHGGLGSVPGKKRIYGGTRLAFEIYAEDHHDTESLLCMTFFNLIDLPLCLLLDTILLPSTTFHTFAYTQEEKERLFSDEHQRRRNYRDYKVYKTNSEITEHEKQKKPSKELEK